MFSTFEKSHQEKFALAQEDAGSKSSARGFILDNVPDITATPLPLPEKRVEPTPVVQLKKESSSAVKPVEVFLDLTDFPGCRYCGSYR